jgi:hypothetical protein
MDDAQLLLKCLAQLNFVEQLKFVMVYLGLSIFSASISSFSICIQLPVLLRIQGILWYALLEYVS